MTEDSAVHTCNMHYHHVPKDFFFLGGGGGGGGRDIERNFNGQDHQTSMARIGVSICSIWPLSLRSSDGIGKQYPIAQQYIVENHKNTKQ